MNKFDEKKQEYIALLLARRKAEDDYRAARRAYEETPIPNWVEYLAQGLGETVMELIPDAASVNVSGPFGIGARACIAFEDNDGAEIGYFFISPGELDKGELLLVDMQTNTGEYEFGTIGYVNGFNHPIVPLPEFGELAKLAQRRRKNA